MAQISMTRAKNQIKLVWGSDVCRLKKLTIAKSFRVCVNV